MSTNEGNNAGPLGGMPTFDWKTDNMAENFRLFKQRMNLFFQVKKVKDEDKPAMILLATGNEGLRRFNCWNLSEDDQKKPEVLFEHFEEQLEPQDNYRVCRLKLSSYSQKKDESIDDFVNRCRLLAHKCKLSNTELDERLLELIIASTPISDFQRELLEKSDKFTLKEAVELGRKYEALDAYASEIQALNAATASKAATSAETPQVAAISRNKKAHSSAGSKQTTDVTATGNGCKNCGRKHAFGRENCPARNSICDSCGRTGHWASVCISSKFRRQQPSRGRGNYNGARGRGQRSVHAVQEQQNTDQQYEEYEAYDNVESQFESLNYHTIKVSSLVWSKTQGRDEAFVNLKVRLENRPGLHNFQLKVDTGAQANTMPRRVFEQMFPTDSQEKVLSKSSHVLTAYNNTVIPCKGVVNILCKFGESEWKNTSFYVVDVPGPAVLGLPTCELLKVVTLHCAVNKEKSPVIDCVQDLVQAYPDQFDKIGNFKTVHKLEVDPNMPGHVDPPRRIPIAMKDKVKCELDKMERQKVIKSIEEPTKWVNSLTYVSKRDGSIRVCLDPRQLNKALIRPYHQTTTVEELNHKFSGAKVFSKLDAKAGYWAVKLDRESQKLTTFQTPFGRYCFLRLPFGLNVSQDLFQMEMDRILQKCRGACGIADDIVIYGKSEKEHDENLIEFMNIAAAHGLTLNSAKCEIKKSRVDFFGNLYTAEGMQPDPKKVRDLKEMKRPKNNIELQQFLGFTNYLSKFIKNYSVKTTVLRELLPKESVFVWEEHHQQCFDALKRDISEDCILRYYDPLKPLVIHCDASMKGVGAAMLQPGVDGTLEPVAYASKSLSLSEQRYACIERELLAIVFASQRFHQFVYGRNFSVITDHKPLVMIMDKPLTSAPARLQRMLVALQGYNFDITYVKGENNQLADGLSRFPNSQNESQVDLGIRVDFVRFSDQKLLELKQCTSRDPIFNQLKEIILIGWPVEMKELPGDIRPYWSFRDQLSVEDGIIVKGSQVMIPPQLRKDILDQLHTAHLGQEKTKLLAKETVYWLNINKDIEERTKSCEICQRHLPAQTAEPLLQHEIPSRPWSVIATDLFEDEGKQHLLIADYYSKWVIVRKLPSPCPSNVVVQIMKEVFSELGIPDKVVSDNGPHYDSETFRSFAHLWGFDHVTTSPRRPQGNGFIERQVQTVKSVMLKARESNTDVDLALLYLRTTPVTNNIPSPAQLLMGRKLKTTVTSKIKNTLPNQDIVHQELTKRQEDQKFYFDRRALKDTLPPLYVGQKVRVQHPTSGYWEPAMIHKCTDDPRSYIVQDANGRVIRRNRQHIREIPKPAEDNSSAQIPGNGINKKAVPQTPSPVRNLVDKHSEVPQRPSAPQCNDNSPSAIAPPVAQPPQVPHSTAKPNPTPSAKQQSKPIARPPVETRSGRVVKPVTKMNI